MFYRIKLMAVLFVFLAAIPTLAHALEQRRNMATMGLDSSYYRYKQDAMKADGFLFGMNGAYTYHGQLLSSSLPDGMLKLDGRILFGRVNFDGRLFDGNNYEIKKVRDFASEFRGLVGYDLSVLSSTTVTPYIGLGYRFLKDDLSRNSAGYRRYSHYFYTPIGFETRTPFLDGWTAGIVLEYDLYWLGWQATELSDLDPLFSDLTNDQKDGYGFRASLKFRKEVQDKNYFFEPYFIYWDIDDSETEYYKHSGVIGGTYREPQNTTTEIGMKVGVEF